MSVENLERLISVLDEEREALTKGDFGALADLVDYKSLLEDRIASGALNEKQLASVRKKASENQNLFAAAIKGFNTARVRLDAMEDVRVGLSTYSKDGEKMRVENLGTSLKKRA